MAEPVDGGVDGDGVEAAGAPLQRPHTSRCAQDLAQPDAAAGEQIATTSAFDGEADGDSLQSSQPREHADVGNSGYSQSSDGASAAVLSGQQPEHGEQRTEPETSVTAENIAARVAKMFVVGAAEAVASGLLRLAPEPTNELVQLAAAHMRDMEKAEVDALSESFGNFDRTVGLGWLLGDAAGRPLMDRKAAHASGLKAARAAGTIKADLRAAKLKAQRAACKLAADDPQRAELKKEADEAERAILNATVDVSLPPATTPAAPPRAAPTGSRKRAREVEREPSHADLVAAAERRLLKAERAVLQAKRRKEKADTAQEDAYQKLERIDRKYDGLEEATDQQLRKIGTADTKAQFKWMGAVCDSKDAESDLLLAMLEESEAEKDLSQLQWGACVQQLDTITNRHASLAGEYRELATRYRLAVEARAFRESYT